MVRPTYLVLHRTEWERLKRQAGSPAEDPVNLKKEYLKALTEKSKEWIKSWPDTVSGHIAELEKQKKEQHKTNIDFVKAYTKRIQQKNTAGAIKEAKQLIFEDSNYGRLLKSALLESKALEVREIQMRFQKELQEKAAIIVKEQEECNNSKFLNFQDNDAERARKEKLATLECDRVNKEIVSQKKEEELLIKQKEKECAIKDEKLLKQVLMIEEQEKDDIKRCNKGAIEKFEADKKAIEKRKVQEKKLNETLTEVYKKGQERNKCKVQGVLKKVHRGRPDTKCSKDHFRKIDQLQKDEKKRYEDFINKGIKTYEERISNEDRKQKAKEKEKISSTLLNSQGNKISGEEERLAKKYTNKCYCDRQSLIIKTGKSIKKIKDIVSLNETQMRTNNGCVARTESLIDHKPLSQFKHEEGSDKAKVSETPTFLAPRNVLLEALKKREKEPTPWNDTKGVHAQFAQQASEVLKEIKHKHLARKVVDEYRKLNSLDATTLPVPNY